MGTEKDTGKSPWSVAKADLVMLKELANADDVSASHTVRQLIRRSHAERFGEKKKPKTRR